MPNIKTVSNPESDFAYKIQFKTLQGSMGQHLGLLAANPSQHMLSVFRNKAFDSVYGSMEAVALSALHVGANDVAMSVTASQSHAVKFAIKNLAKTGVDKIARASASPLDLQAAKLSKMQVADGNRVWRIAKWQLANAYFLGTLYGWQLKRRSRKQWELSSIHDRDDACDEAYEQGSISVFDFFANGKLHPPDHLNCSCTMALFL